MYMNILPVLRCPQCGTTLELTESKKDGEEIIEGKIVCEKGHCYSIRQGILDFQSPEQEQFNSWNEYFDKDGYDDFVQNLDLSKTESQKKTEKDFVDGIVEEVTKLKTGFLLDVASGRGILLEALLKNGDIHADIISADLSFTVLIHDRIKFRRLYPNRKVNYIACDATNLPIRDHSIDMACTFMGFLNMANLMENGIRDTARVLKQNAPLVNSTIYMDKNAEGAKRTARYFAENHMEGGEKIYIRDELLAIHKKYFRSVRERIIYEGIAESLEDDLIPCAGEWYANVMILSE